MTRTSSTFNPYVGQAREKDSLFKIYHIFKKLLLERSQPERACEFLDRHLRGNMIIKENDVVYAYRESTGFKPLVKGRDSRNSLFIVASENSLGTFLQDVNFEDIKPGQLLALNLNNGQEIISSLPMTRTMLDPFEFVRESHASRIHQWQKCLRSKKKDGKDAGRFPRERDQY